MRIVHIIARMNVGGTSTYLKNLVRGQIARGHEVLLLTGNVPSNEKEDSDLNSLPFKRIVELSREIAPLKDFFARRKVLSRIEEFQPDIIHSHTFKAGVLVRSLRLKCPVVHTFHGHHLYDPEFGKLKRAALNFIERRLAHRSSILVAVGEQVAKELVQQGIGNLDKFVSIPPGIVDFNLLDNDSCRASLGIETDEFVIMWLGRFTRVKRPDLVLELAKKMPSLNFYMAGTGELVDQIENNAPGNLHLLGFRLKEELWSVADVGLCTSDSEGMPLALIEAQIAGVPVVSTNVGSVSEIVEDGVTGCVVGKTVHEIQSGIEKTLKLLRDNEDVKSTIRERALNLFSVDVMVSKHDALYERSISREN